MSRLDVLSAQRTGLLRGAGLALGALALGAFIYGHDRPPQAAWLLPAWLQSAGAGSVRWLGSAGDWLPSFLHAFAFALLTASVVAPPVPAPRHARAVQRTPRGVVAACIGWWLVDSAFELGQHPDLSHAIAEALPAAWARIPVLDHVGSSLTRGTFDLADLAAIAVGAVAAFVAWRGSVCASRVGGEA